jgi:hypothetical protein
VTLALGPSFEPSEGARTVEAAATINGVARQDLQSVDGLGIRSGTVAQSGDDDDETQRRLTEEQRQPRERTDAADLGDYRDEGRVTGLRCGSDGPTDAVPGAAMYSPFDVPCAVLATREWLRQAPWCTRSGRCVRPSRLATARVVLFCHCLETATEIGVRADRRRTVGNPAVAGIPSVGSAPRGTIPRAAQ